MKKRLLILITITFVNLSYASFPVKEDIQNQILQETIVSEAPDNFFDKAATMSLILTSVAALFVLLFANSDLTTIGLALITFLILAVASIFAIFGLFSKTNWWKGLFALIATSLLLPLLFS